MKRYFIFLLLSIIALNTMGQIPPSTDDETFKLPLKKSTIDAYKRLSKKENYIEVANFRNGKRWRYFESDLFRFKTKSGQYFEEEIETILDSTFTIFRFSRNEGRMESLTFDITDIKSVYKHKRGGVIATGLYSIAPFLPMALLDWGLYRNNPLKNKDLLIITPIVGLGNIALIKHKTFFNKQRIRRNKEIRIIHPL